MTETIVKHKAHRLCTDAANALWDRISFWTHGSDVEFDDGSTAVDLKADVASIKDSILDTVEECEASTDPDDIAGAAALSELNSNLSDLIKSVSYTYASKTVAADDLVTFTPNNSPVPSGYTAIAVRSVNAGNLSTHKLTVRSFNISGTIVVYNNSSSGSYTANPSMTIICIKSGFVSS